jgi:DNA-nicking Smr family endonuclease
MRIPRKKLPPPAAPAAASDEDAALFRSAIGEVRELPPMAVPPSKPRPAAVPAQREADENEALQQSRLAPFSVEGSDVLLYRRDEVPPRVLKRLRRGLYTVQVELDLHRLLLVQAERALRRFLREARDAEHTCVRIIHGKGLHSGAVDGPVLKALVERQLSQRRDVLAYASAPPAMGGTGAVLVLLARQRAGEAKLSSDDP